MMRASGFVLALGPCLASLLACAQAPSDPLLQRGPVSPEVQACLERPGVQDYIAYLRERIIERWELPEGVAPHQEIEILFSIRADGSLRGAIVPDALTQQIEDSALEAIHAAAPFEAPSQDASCLVELPLRAEFRNPTRP